MRRVAREAAETLKLRASSDEHRTQDTDTRIRPAASSLHCLLKRIIDFAGVFPPANLPVERAIDEYARCRKSTDGWMLGRFVCPIAKLAAVEKCVSCTLGASAKLHVTVIAAGAPTVEEFLVGLQGDLEALVSFQRRCEPHVKIDTLELRFPQELIDLDHAESVCKTVHRVSASLDSLAIADMYVYYEAPVGPRWQTLVSSVLSGLSSYNAGLRVNAGVPSSRYAGFKLRCIDPGSSSVPSADAVAFVISRARDLSVPLKATGGLHHPLRYFCHDVQTHKHGFINVLAASTFAYLKNLAPERLQEILEDELPSNFVFERDTFSWHELRASLSELDEARKQQMTSFGSCSFLEPCDALRSLGFLRD